MATVADLLLYLDDRGIEDLILRWTPEEMPHDAGAEALRRAQDGYAALDEYLAGLQAKRPAAPVFATLLAENGTQVGESVRVPDRGPIVFEADHGPVFVDRVVVGDQVFQLNTRVRACAGDAVRVDNMGWGV